MASSLVKLVLSVGPEAFQLPDTARAIPQFPYDTENSLFRDTIYPLTLNGAFPLVVAIVYFTTVHAVNRYIARCQVDAFKAQNPGQKPPASAKQLPAVPFKISQTKTFKWLVILHNVFLCVYSMWTFVGMTSTLVHLSSKIVPALFNQSAQDLSVHERFWQSICNNSSVPLWSNSEKLGLTYWGYLFYLSKFYEIFDTVIILLKGRPSSLLQSYHHSGAMLCMWSGVRFMSPPIWIFVVFNSFIHSIMYGYYTLCCFKIRVPKWFKQSLTTMQITQFVVGGSLAAFHLFVHYFDIHTGQYQPCIGTSEQAMALYINVFYLAPLTMLFGAFYIDSYRKKNQQKLKKN